MKNKENNKSCIRDDEKQAKSDEEENFIIKCQKKKKEMKFEKSFFKGIFIRVHFFVIALRILPGRFWDSKILMC